MIIGKIDNVPQMALNDCISSGVPHGTTPGSGLCNQSWVQYQPMPTNFKVIFIAETNSKSQSKALGWQLETWLRATFENKKH